MAPDMRNVLLVAALVLVGLAGCLDDDSNPDEPPAAVDGYRYAGDEYVMEGEWSVPLQPALFDALPGEKVRVAVRDGVEMSVGVFRPDKDGCDWSAASLPSECQLPVVMSASPYYLETVGEPSGRPPLPEWLVPRDFIVVQMSLRGTGESGGCMEYKDPTDVDDISDVVDWIVDQAWSNGNVGVAGRSYVGTSSWAAAASGNPHVKTIMPISGAVSSPDLLFRNGTHELRALIPHIPVYWATYAFAGSTSDAAFMAEHAAGNICPGVVEPHVEGPLSALTGDASSDFWQNRDLRQAILDNYEGSAWVIHGMVDWNVDPSQAVPFVNDMMDAGIPTLAWLGQWAHAYPDNTIEHSNTRWDWSTQVVDWFEHWLRGNGPEPVLGVEVEDDTLRWRHEDRFPPAAEWVELDVPGGQVTHLQEYTTSWTAAADMQVSGLIQLPLDVTPTGPGGQLAIELFDDTLGKRVGWGVIDLRNAAGGNTNPQTVVPGSTITLHIQFEPADSVVQAGDMLRLVIGRNGVQDINPDTLVAPITIDGGTLRLPTVMRDNFIPIPLPESDPRNEL